MGELTGRAAVVTGASQGLGFEIAKTFAESGADLVLCARDANALEDARRRIEDLSTGSRLITRSVDVSDAAQVDAMRDAALAAFPDLDIIVNNAGVYGPMGAIEDVDWGEWVRAVEINLFGSILVCRAFLPHLKRLRRGKIIQLSGGGATNPLPGISAYAASKAAIVRFAETLAEEVREYGIDVNSIAPGPLNTRLLDEVLAAGPDKVGEQFYARSIRQKEEGGAPLNKGAELALFLASRRSDAVTAKLISAVWDPYEELPQHAGDLRGDVYTLRRIVPKDRGLTWGVE